jgi:hypothetical protein
VQLLRQRDSRALTLGHVSRGVQTGRGAFFRPYNKRRTNRRWPQKDKEITTRINKLAMYRLPPERKAGRSNRSGRSILFNPNYLGALRHPAQCCALRKRSNVG